MADFLLDTNCLRHTHKTRLLAKKLAADGDRLVVGTPSLAEFLRHMRARKGAEFDLSLLFDDLKKSYPLHFEPFGEDDAIALEAWTLLQVGDDETYQRWKVEKATRELRPWLAAQGCALPPEPVIEDRHGAKVSSTVDWLIAGMVTRLGATLVTFEAHKPYWEFVGLPITTFEAWGIT
jgi:hypothetical protein